MNKVIISNEDSIKNPANDGDVGFDLIACEHPVIVGEKVDELNPYYKSISYIEYDTGLKIQPEEGYYSLVYPRSSISKTNLVLANSVGVIDNGYRGTIKLRFKYVAQPEDISFYGTIKQEDYYPSYHACTEVNELKIYKKGDRIGQLVFVKCEIPTCEIGEVSETERGEGGFGSTGR